ncbi:MAG: ABC transporter ATP-binding protein [Ignavibacteriaceae bacterium]|jgi:heme exporter protein A
MSNYSLQAINLNKTFGRRLIFKDLTFKVEDYGIAGISGANGSGKSTLVKILAGVDSPTSGKVIHIGNGKEILPDKLHNHIGFVSPYLVLYEEFSAWENLNHFARIRDVKFDNEKITYLLNQFLLFDRRNDFVKTFSSGMKQRLKFIFALMHSPKLIILDEPTSNLDTEGKDSIYKIIEEESKSGIVIIASNEKSDLALCSVEIKLEEYKNHK